MPDAECGNLLGVKKPLRFNAAYRNLRGFKKNPGGLMAGGLNIEFDCSLINNQKLISMKQTLRIAGLRSFFTLLCVAIVQAAVLAQDAQGGGSTTTTVTKSETTTWYTNPWIWVVGAAVFILLLIALLRGGSGRQTSSASDRVTVTKTVSRE